jgi:hypothetical protein
LPPSGERFLGVGFLNEPRSGKCSARRNAHDELKVIAAI